MTKPVELDPMVNHEAVDAVSVESGAIMAKWFCHEAERVYAVFNENNTDRQFRRLVEWIESRGGSVSVRETQQGRRQHKTAKDAESALGKLVKAGLGRWEPIQQKAKGGRASTRFTLYTTSTVYTTPLKAEENKGCVDVDSAKYPKTEKSAHGDWGEV